jgi:hypothetical protein
VMTETMMSIMVDGNEMTKTGVTATNADAATGYLLADLQADLQVGQEAMGETQADLRADAMNYLYDAERIDLVTLTHHGRIVVAVKQKQQ